MFEEKDSLRKCFVFIPACLHENLDSPKNQELPFILIYCFIQAHILARQRFR